jgi:AraC-like DNA-binding protein
MDMTEERTGQALPTATGFGARLTIAVLKKHNVAPAPILGRAGLSEQDFDSRQRRISAASESKCLEYAAEAMDDSAFGLHLAEEANPREAGLPFYIASAANNLGEALALFARYGRIVNEAMRIKLARGPEGVVAEITFGDHSRHSAKHVTEFAIAIIVKGVREVAGRNIRPMHVSFAHGRNSDLRAFERFFGCPVEFGASRDQLAFSHETLALPLVTEDRHLLETLQPVCDADEGTTYEQVLDQLRQSLALQYIKEQGVSLSQIAWLLGYERSTSFNHAFRRWTGRSPSLVRNEKLVAASV